MIKELILAIIIGGLLGLGITGGYLTMHQKNNPSTNNDTIISEPTLVPTSTNQNQSNEKELSSINITSPEDNALLSSNKTTINGTTTPESNIIIATPNNTFTGKSDKDGNFEINIELEAGLNIVKISSIDPNNNQKDTTINITYSSAKI